MHIYIVVSTVCQTARLDGKCRDLPDVYTAIPIVLIMWMVSITKSNHLSGILSNLSGEWYTRELILKTKIVIVIH